MFGGPKNNSHEQISIRVYNYLFPLSYNAIHPDINSPEEKVSRTNKYLFTRTRSYSPELIVIRPNKQL